MDDLRLTSSPHREAESDEGDQEDEESRSSDGCSSRISVDALEAYYSGLVGREEGPGGHEGEDEEKDVEDDGAESCSSQCLCFTADSHSE